MSEITVTAKTLSGAVAAIPSKSQVHRLLICGALSGSPTVLGLRGGSEDITATARCLEALGAEISRGGDALHISPIPSEIPDAPVLDCGESGSTLRFLLPVAAALGCGAAFMGAGRLPQRPLEPLLSQLTEHGAVFSSSSLPLRVAGRLAGGVFTLPGDVSSQYVTGLLLALPLVGGGEIRLTTPLQSAGYVEMTRAAMAAFGINVRASGESIIVPPDAAYHSPGRLSAEGDWSNAALWLCAGALSGPVTVTGLDTASPQGDRAVLDILKRFGASVAAKNGAVTVARGALRGMELDAGDIPDLIPALAVVAAGAEGTTRVHNAGRLRLKESDRLAAVAGLLTGLGGKAEIRGDELRITGGARLRGGAVPGRNDHRMVMGAALASLISDAPVTVTDSAAVNKSYPGFFEDFTALGGSIHVQRHR